MNSQTSTADFQYLSSICDDHSTLTTRITAISSLNSKNLHAFEGLILILEYIQLISQALLIFPALYQDASLDGNVLYQGFIFIAKLMNPGFWMVLEGYEAISLIILICFALSIVFKYMLFLYIFVILYKNIRGWMPLITLWRIIFKTQSRVLCYFATSYWIQLILMVSGRDSLIGIQSTGLIILAASMYALEYIFSFFLQTQYCNVLPTKSFLTCKDNHLEIITLLQKFIIQILQMSVSLNSAGIAWLFTTINVVFGLLRESYYYATLSFYNIKALFYQATLLMLVFSLNLSSFINNMVDNGNMSFIITTWILLAILTGIASHQYLDKLLLELISGKTERSCLLLIQKIAVIQHLRKLWKLPSEHIQKYDRNLLYNSSAFIQAARTLESNPEFKNGLDIRSKQSMNKIFQEYLHSLAVKFPKNEFLRLYIAYFYAKKLKLFGVAIKDINELKKSHSHKIAISGSLLLYNIQDTVKKQYEHSQSLINLTAYLKSKALVVKMEQKMMEQFEAQKKLYHEIITESTNLQKLFDYAGAISKARKQIHSQMPQVFARIPETYTQSYMIASLYHLSLNHSISDYLNYRKRYTHLHAKHEKHFRAEKLTNENIYQDDCVFAIYTGQKPEAGKITYCSRSIKAHSGKEPQHYVGRSGALFPPPSLRPFYERFFQNLAEKADRSILGRTIRGQIYHKDGFVTPCDFYTDIHPFMTQGFYLDIVLRPLKLAKETILILDNGDIECGTKNIATKLGILRPEAHEGAPFINIKVLSQELKDMNDAFNLVDALKKGKVQREDWKKAESDVSNISKSSQSPGISPGISPGVKHKKSQLGLNRHMSLEKAEELHEIYTTKGRELVLASALPRSHNTYTYHCTVESKFYGPLHAKLITLEAVEELDPEDDDEVSVKCKLVSTALQAPRDTVQKSEDFNSKENEEIMNDSGDFSSQDEKKNGRITSLGNQMLSAATVPFETIEAPLMSPLSGATFLMTPKAPLLQQKTDKSHEKASRSTLGEEVHKIEHVAKGLIAEGSIASQKSKTSQQKKISSAFRTALSVKHPPTEFRIMGLIYYSLLIVVFVIQLVLKDTLDQAVTELRIGKDIIANAEERSYILANDMLMTRLIWDIGTQRINSTGLGNWNYPPSVWGSFLLPDALNMANVNHELLTNASLLDDDKKKGLFTSDIRIFETNADRLADKYSTLNNFQAIERILTVALQVATLVDDTPVIDLQDQISFLIENTVNDIYVKNEAISDSFMDSFVTSQESIDSAVTAIATGSSLLYFVVSVVLSVIIWRKYRTERFHLVAVAQLNHRGIHSALDQMHRFRRALENEAVMGNPQNSISISPRRSHREISFKAKEKKERLKTPNHRGLQTKYTLFAGRLWILIALLIGLTIGCCLSERNSITFFQRKQAQLYFTQRLKSHITLVGVVTQELFAGNGTTLNNNKPTADLIGPLIQYMIILKNRVATTYMNEDYNYNPNISDILFVDGCSSIEDPTWNYFCFQKEGHGEKTGMIYLLGDMEGLAENKKLRFDAIDRNSSAALAAAQIEDFQEIVIDYFAITEQCKAIAKILNKEFENELEGSKSERNTIFLIFTLLIIFLGFLSWIFIFASLRNYNQRVKGVMQAFPASLILSNFMLKTFLINTSKGALDSIKNEI